MLHSSLSIGICILVSLFAADARAQSPASAQIIIEQRSDSIKDDASFFHGALKSIGDVQAITSDGFESRSHKFSGLKRKDLQSDNALVFVEFYCSERLFGLASYETFSGTAISLSSVRLSDFVSSAFEVPDLKSEWTLYRRAASHEYSHALNGLHIKDALYRIQRATLGLSYDSGQEDARFGREVEYFYAFPKRRSTFAIPAPGGSVEFDSSTQKENLQKIKYLLENQQLVGTVLHDVAICTIDGKHKPRAVRKFILEATTPGKVSNYLAALADLALSQD